MNVKECSVEASAAMLYHTNKKRKYYFNSCYLFFCFSETFMGEIFGEDKELSKRVNAFKLSEEDASGSFIDVLLDLLPCDQPSWSNLEKVTRLCMYL